MDAFGHCGVCVCLSTTLCVKLTSKKGLRGGETGIAKCHRFADSCFASLTIMGKSVLEYGIMYNTDVFIISLLSCYKCFPTDCPCKHQN